MGEPHRQADRAHRVSNPVVCAAAGDLEANRFLLEEALGEIGADVVCVVPAPNGSQTARALKERSGAPFTYVIERRG